MPFNRHNNPVGEFPFTTILFAWSLDVTTPGYDDNILTGSKKFAGIRITFSIGNDIDPGSCVLTGLASIVKVSSSVALSMRLISIRVTLPVITKTSWLSTS